MAVRILVITFYFNPEIKRALVTFSKGINLQRTVLLSEVPHQLCAFPVLLHYLRLDWVINELISGVFPHPSEFRELLSWIWEVIRAGDDYTGPGETFD